MADFTTTTRVKDLLNQSGTGFHNAFDDDAITNAVAYANDITEEFGADTNALNSRDQAAADLFALAYLARGIVLQMSLRGESHPAIDSIATFAENTYNNAVAIVSAGVQQSMPKPKVVQNKSWRVWGDNRYNN